MSVIVVPKILYEKLSEEGVEALVEVVNKSTEKQKEETIVYAEERYEKRLVEEISKLDNRVNNRITEEISKVNNRITEEIQKLRVEMSRYPAQVIKWTFIFIFGQFWAIVATIIGVLFAFFRR